MNATIDIQGTATPVDGSSHPSVVTVQGPITTPELMVPFTGLHADTTYSFVFEALSRDIPSPCSGVPITDVFLRTDQQMLSGELLYVVWLPEIYFENAINMFFFLCFSFTIRWVIGYWCSCGYPHRHLFGVFPNWSPAGYTHHLLLCQEEEEQWTIATLLYPARATSTLLQPVRAFTWIFWGGDKACGHIRVEGECCIWSCATLTMWCSF